MADFEVKFINPVDIQLLECDTVCTRCLGKPTKLFQESFMPVTNECYCYWYR